MTSPFLYLPSSLDMLQSQGLLARPTTSADTTKTRYITEDTVDQQQQCQQQQPTSSISLLSEFILSTWLESECNHQTQSPIISIQPIHHTLENATITYDTLAEQQKELVKDVFFSPAMSSTNKSTSYVTLLSSLSTNTTPRTTTSSSSDDASTPACSDDDTTTFCGSQTDGESLEDDFSPFDLLLEQDDASLFYGALDLEQQLLSIDSPCSDPLDATTAISAINHQHTPSLLKRKRNDTGDSSTPVLSRKRDPWTDVLSPKSTPPMSPNEYKWDDFDASGEDSSTDDDTASSHDYQTMKADFQFISMQDADILDDDNNDIDGDSGSIWKSRHANMSAYENKTKPSKKKLTPTKQQQLITTASTSSTNNKRRKQHKKSKLPAPTSMPPFENHDHLKKVKPRPTYHPTLYQKLTKTNVDWCRYCGTTEGVNWRPGPWGKRTLCNKHGCDYKGYGFACKLPRLNLTGYVHESIHDRDRPVLQFYCATCYRTESWATNILVRCEGCYKSYHQKCYRGQEQPLTDAFVAGHQHWYCEDSCRENAACGRVVVEISRKRLPLMRAPIKNQAQQANLCNNNHHPQYASTSIGRAGVGHD